MEPGFRELCGAEDLLQSFPLHRACRDGDLASLTGLLGGAVLSVCDAGAQDPIFGWTPAHWAAHNGKVECLEMLIKAGLPCDIATHGTGLTLAHVAALEGQTVCLAWLCQNGVSINAQDHMGETASHKAVRCGSVECLHILRKHGADFSLRSSIGITVMDLAVQNQQTQCVEYFRAGGDSHLTDHMTCMNGRRKRMQASEESEIEMDPAKRARVENELPLGISHPPGQKLDHMMNNGDHNINQSEMVSGVGSVDTIYAITQERHLNGCSRHENSESRAIPTEEETTLSCTLQGANYTSAIATDVDGMNMSCSDEQTEATDDRLVGSNKHTPEKSCVDSPAAIMTTFTDHTPRDYWMECFIPASPIPKCRALSGHYL